MSNGGALRSIFALFDVSTGNAEAKVERLNQKTTGAKESLAALGGALVGAFSLHAVAGFFNDMIELGSVLNDTSERLGIATDDLQRFQYAAGLSGVNAEEAGRALGFLNKNMGEAIGGSKEQAQMFAELDVAMKNADGSVRELGDVIPEVADAFAKMGSDQERTAAAMKLFGKSGASLIPLLKNGSEELTKLNAQFTELGLGINEDFIKKADEAGDSIDTMKLGFSALGTDIAGEMLPTIKEWSTKISRWIRTAREWAQQTTAVRVGLFGLGSVAAAAGVKTFSSWTKVLGLFPKNGNLLSNLFGAGKFGLYVGGLVLMALAMDDLITMCEGGDSVIGDFFDKFVGVDKKKELIDSLTNAWKSMGPALEQLGPMVAGLGTTAAKVLPYLIAAVTDYVRLVLGGAKGILAFVKAGADLVKGKSAADVGDEFYQSTNDLFGKKGLMNHSTLVDFIKAPATATVSASAAGVPYGPPPPPANVEAKTTINVNGAGDPNAVAQRVAGIQRDTYERAAANALATGPE